MPKYCTLLFLVVLSTNLLRSQAVLTDSRFYTVGDHLNYHLVDIDNIAIGEASAQEQEWDFTHLSGTEVWTDTFLAAAVGAFADTFPDANVLQRSPNGREEYLQINSSAILSHGYIQDLLGVSFPVRYQEPRILIENPTTFGDVLESSREGGFAIGLADYPIIDSLLGTLDLGELSGTLDSLRLLTTTTTRQEADAWGTCQISTGSFEVLRLAQQTSTTTSLEVHVNAGPFSFWIDLGNFFEELDFEPLSTEQTYQYIAPDHKTIIADIRLSPSGEITRVLIADLEPISSTTSITHRPSNLRLYPNPTKDWVHFQTALPDGRYQVRLYNMEGRLIELTSVSISGGAGKYQLRSTLAGIYLFQMTNAYGQLVGSGRLLVE